MFFHYNWVLFPLWPGLFILSGAICLLFPNSICILDTYQPGGLIFWCHIFCLFMLFMWFWRQECWSGLPFPSTVDHVWSELFTMTCPSSVSLHGMWLIVSLNYTRLWSMWSFWFTFWDCCFCSRGCRIIFLAFSICPLVDEAERLVQASWWEGLTEGNLGLALVGRAMLSTPLIQILLMNGAVLPPC